MTKCLLAHVRTEEIEDLRAVAKVVYGKKVTVDAMVVPGSGLVKEQAEKEGLE